MEGWRASVVPTESLRAPSVGLSCLPHFLFRKRLRWTGQVVRRADLMACSMCPSVPGREVRVTEWGRSHLGPVQGWDTPL